MTANDLRSLSVSELEQKGQELRDELFNSKIKHATGQLENTSKIGSLKRDVARVETVLVQKREASK